MHDGPSRKPTEGTDLMAAVGIMTAVFILQAWNLHDAALPATDEGVYGLIGRLMMRGFVPHTDFPMYHMPLLPLLMGMGLKLTNDLYWLRLAYLAINCLAGMPLFLLIKRWSGSGMAALTALAFYFSFNEMMDHDFRFLAIRQSANVLLILFLWCGICAPDRPWRTWVQAACCVLSAMLFLPAGLNMALAAAALTAAAPRSGRPVLARRFVLMLLAAAGCAVAYLLVMRHAPQQLLFDHLSRMPYGRWARLVRIAGKPDLLLTAFGSASLALGMFSLPGRRALCAAMLLVTGLAVLLPVNYFDHYLSLAGPALSIGIAAGVLLVRDCFQVLPARGRGTATAAACLLLVGLQWRFAVPSLLNTWTSTGFPQYREAVSALRPMPEPVLLTQAVYAADADKLPVLSFYKELFRPPAGPPITHDEYVAALRSACTIFIDGNTRTVIPAGVLAAWTGSSVKVFGNGMAEIYRTHNPSCPHG